jgi:RimJ/RimL family protein N-acetyltransferase
MPTDFTAATATPYRCGRNVAIRALDIERDPPLLHRWFTMDYAAFWNMQDQSERDIRELYRAMTDSGHATACMGLVDDAPAFLVECYDPSNDELARHYPVRAGDVGMHFLVGPPQQRVHGHSRLVFRSLMRFIFDRLQARRVVVEPDVRNDKVHVLNREMGFAFERYVQLPHKLARLAFCTREQFVIAQAHIDQEECTE